MGRGKREEGNHPQICFCTCGISKKGLQTNYMELLATCEQLSSILLHREKSSVYYLSHVFSCLHLYKDTHAEWKNNL